MANNRFLFGPLTSNSQSTDLGLLILRVFVGLALAFGHGLGKVPPSDGFIGMLGDKGLPAPGLLAWLSALAEFFGALLLALGLLTRPATVFIIINMLVVVFVGHAGQGFGEREKGLLFLFIALQFFFTGPGRYSVDDRLGRRPV